MKKSIPGMAISLALILGSCISQPKNDGPYFGNGFHNGWADQQSILWEFSCGAGSDSHAEGWNQEDVRPEHRFLRVKGGFLRGTVSQENDHKVLILSHYNVEGQVVHTEEFRR